MMSFKIKDKVALITGGAGGIGFHFAKELLKNGAKGVTIADISIDNGRKAVEELQLEFGENRVIFVATDISNIRSFKDAFEETINKFDNLDILINNAAILDDRRWELEIDINIKGTIHGIILGLENYLQKYRAGPEGVIVNISSSAGIEAYKEIPIYTGTKFAIAGMSRAWGHQMHYERTKIKLLTIYPNRIDTQMSTNLNLKCFKPEYGQDFLDVIENLPTQTPEKVAKNVVKIIETGKPGSEWFIEGGREPFEI